MKAVVSFVCVALWVVSASAEVRAWRDRTGKFSIRAELVEANETVVGLRRTDGTVIKVPVDRLSGEDRRFLESQEKNAFTDTASAKSAAKKAPGFRYGWKVGQTYPYMVKIEADLGDDVLEMTGTPSYTVVSADKDKTVLSFRGALMEHERPKNMATGFHGPGRMGLSRYGFPGPRIHPFSPLTGVGPLGMARGTELTVDPQGNIARQEGTSQLPFILGNLSQLMIEPFPAAPERVWTVSHESGVVIKEGGFPRFGPFANDEGYVPAKERITYSVESTTDKLVIIRKQYEFRAVATGSDKPPFEITGDGKWTFNKAEGVSDDLDFSLKLSIRKGGLGIEIPVKATYHLLDKAEQAKAAEQSKEMAEKAKKMLADRTKPPSSEEAKSLVGDLESGDMGRIIRATVQLMQKKPKEPNRALAKALETVLSANENVSLRINAALALQNWGTKESLPALKKALKDSNRLMQIQADKAIAEINSRDY